MMTLKGGATTVSSPEDGAAGPEAGETGEVLCIEDWVTGEVVAAAVLDRVRRRVRLAIRGESHRQRLEELFAGQPLLRFSAGFQTPDGVCGDAVERIDLWDPRAVRCLDEKLYVMGLRLAPTQGPRPPDGGADAAGAVPA